MTMSMSSYAEQADARPQPNINPKDWDGLTTSPQALIEALRRCKELRQASIEKYDAEIAFLEDQMRRAVAALNDDLGPQVKATGWVGSGQSDRG